MTNEEAHRIAYHHLGSWAYMVTNCGDSWTIMIDDVQHGESTATTGATVEDAAVKAVAILRARGVVFHHARLEWIREYDDFTLCLTAGKVWTDLCFIGRPSCMGPKYRDVQSAPGVEPKLEFNAMHLPEAVAYISAWAAENLPYHIPVFPWS